MDNGVDIADIDLDDNEFEDLMIGNSVKVLLKDIDLIKWRQDLEDDKGKLESILTSAKKVTPQRDAKLSSLKKILERKQKNPINAGNKKVIIFTAFADTANYLYDHLHKTSMITTAIVTGSGNNRSTIEIPSRLKKQVRLSDLNTVLTLFSPKSKERVKIFPEMTGEIDMLIGTDCISEGQNLQDCDFLINLNDSTKNTIDEFVHTDWLNKQDELFDRLNILDMNIANFYTLYCGFVDAISIYNVQDDLHRPAL